MPRANLLAVAAIGSILLGSPLFAQTTKTPPKPIEVKIPVRKDKGPVSYAKEVAEVLENKCAGCHGSALAESKLNMEEVAGMLKGGKHGPAIVPGKADSSLLFKMAAHQVEPVMPPKDKPANKPLTSDELGVLKLWIDAGAKDDSDESEEKVAKPVELGALPPGVHPINAVDLTADGKLVAVGRADVVQVYDVETGRELISLGGHKDLIQSVRFSPDGSLLAAGSYQIVTVWNVPKGAAALKPETEAPKKEEWTLRHTLGPHVFRVLAIDFSPDGSLLATGGGEPSRSGELKLWEIKKGLLVHSFDLLHSDTVYGIRFSPDGSKLATVSADKFVKVVDVPARKLIRAFEGHSNHVLAVDWKSDGKRLVSGGADHVLKVWDLDTGDLVKTIAAGGKAATSVRWIAGKAEALTATGDAKVKIWNPEGAELSKDFTGPNDYVFAVAASADGSRVAAGGSDGILYIWDGKTAKVLRKLEPKSGTKK